MPTGYRARNRCGNWQRPDAMKRVHIISMTSGDAYDARRDQAFILEQQIGFYELDKQANCGALSALEAARLLLIREGDLVKRLGIPCIDNDAPPLARQLLSLNEMLPGKDADALIQTTYHSLGKWLQRAKVAGIEYLPALDLAVQKYGKKVALQESLEPVPPQKPKAGEMLRRKPPRRRLSTRPRNCTRASTTRATGPLSR